MFANAHTYIHRAKCIQCVSKCNVNIKMSTNVTIAEMKQCYHNIYSQEMNKNLQEITATKVCWYYTQISSLEVAVQLRK